MKLYHVLPMFYQLIKMVTTKVFLKVSKKRKNGQVPVVILITKSRRYSYINIGIKLEHKFWDDIKGRSKSFYPNYT